MTPSVLHNACTISPRSWRLRELAQAFESELKTALTSVSGVQVFTIEIPDHTFILIDQESPLEEDIQEAEQLCENT